MLNLLEGKKRHFVILRKPIYLERHKDENADFLVLACGPSLAKYKNSIQNFIKEHRVITIGCNFLNNMFIPDYHIFINRKRFCDYVQFANKKSTLLLSPFISRRIIKDFIDDRHYEEIMFKNIYPADIGNLTIKKGIIYAKGATVAIIACGIAIVMGARNIFVAGLDGFSLNFKNTHYYNEQDVKFLKDLLIQEKCTHSALKEISSKLIQNQRVLKIITPTVYKEYHDEKILE